MPRAEDPVTRLLARARAADAGAFLAGLDALSERELLRFDARWRTWDAPHVPEATGRMAAVLGLVSHSGFERERAVGAVQLRRGTIGLIALRATDWVPEVRRAALFALARVPAAVLLDVLALVDVLTRERDRAGELDALVEQQLADGDLRAATHAADPGARRAAWRRLDARGAITAAELLERVARDPDVLVRALAAARLPALAPPDRRALATVLLDDPVGWIAGRGLEVLVGLDGAAAIVPALVAPSTTLRRSARGWAAVRGVDARAVYHERLARDPSDAVALVGLAEIGDRADDALLLGALRDPRTRVRAAVLQAVARFDHAVAQAAAMDDLAVGSGGRAGRVAAAIVRGAPLRPGDADRLERIALDGGRADGERLRAIALLRRDRWRQLAVLLDARRGAAPPLREPLGELLREWIRRSAQIRRGPGPQLRARLDELVGAAGDAERRALRWVLDTTT